MPATQKGIFHNLRESEYTVSNTEIVFFFSSKLYKNKFMDRYKDHRIEFNEKADKLMQDTPLNLDTMADITLYRKIEKRGFYVRMKGMPIKWEELHQYALRKMMQTNTPNWSEIPRAKSGMFRKNMGSD